MYQRTKSTCPALTFIGAQFGGHLLIDDCIDPCANDSQRPSHLKGFSMRIHRNQFAPCILIHLFFDPTVDDPNLDVTEESLLLSNVHFPIGCSFRRRRNELPAMCYSFNYSNIGHLREQIGMFTTLAIETYFPNAPEFYDNPWWKQFVIQYGHMSLVCPQDAMGAYPTVAKGATVEVTDLNVSNNPIVNLTLVKQIDQWHEYGDVTLKYKVRYSPFTETLVISVTGIPELFGDRKVKVTSFPATRPQYDIINLKKSTDGTYAMSILSSRHHRGSDQPPVLLPDAVANEVHSIVKAALFMGI